MLAAVSATCLEVSREGQLLLFEKPHCCIIAALRDTITDPAEIILGIYLPSAARLIFT